jgi:hypothetical protein
MDVPFIFPLEKWGKNGDSYRLKFSKLVRLLPACGGMAD